MKLATSIACILLLALTTRNSYAQLGLTSRAHNTFPGMTIGIKAGVNFQRTVGNAAWDESFSSGPIIGAWATWEKNRHGLRVELFAKTAKVQDIYKREIKNTYVDLPVLYYYRIHHLITLNIGAVGSYMASSRDLTGGSNMRFLFTRLQLSAAAGAGVRISDRMSADARYLHGLTDANRYKNPAYTTPWKTSCLQLTLGYRFFE